MDCQLCEAHQKTMKIGACEMSSEQCVYRDCVAHHILLEVRRIIGAEAGDGTSLLIHLEDLMERLQR